VEDDAQAVDVASLVHQLALPHGLLGAHVSRGAHEGSIGREARIEIGPARKTEIGQVWVALLVDQNVRRFEVAVEDASTVGVIQRIGQAPHQSR
jgi:hypothetical protein